ncbi:hypothetical protein T12_12046, partial [Trichinella patagoniensis]
MILPYTTKPSHVANKVVLNMIKRGLQASVALCLLLFVLGGAGCSKFNWLFVTTEFLKWRKKNGAKLRLLRNFKSFKRLIQTVTNMKRIDIARMMKIPSSRLSAVRRYVCSFNVDENVVNQLSKIGT